MNIYSARKTVIYNNNVFQALLKDIYSARMIICGD